MIKAFQSVLTKILAATMALTAVCCVAACGGKKTESENVEVTLNKTEIELTEGETFRLTVTVSPADAKDKKIEWRVSDPLIASVEEGLVTAKKAGETTVTAHTNEKTVSCKVKVKAKEDSSDSSSSSESGSESDNNSGSESESGSENNSENSSESSSEESGNDSESSSESR